MQSFDEVSPTYLGADNGISLSINVSHNFANSSHYDALDYGPSIVMWVIDDEAANNCDQYLVFNNIVTVHDGQESKEGVLIKISDGMIMSFQGNNLRHGTTIRHDSITGKLCPPGNVYGIHFGLSMPTLTAMRRMRIDQYVRDMCLTTRIIRHKQQQQPGKNRRKHSRVVKRKINSIRFQKQNQATVDQVAQQMSQSIDFCDNNQSSMEVERSYREIVSSEFNQELLLVDDKSSFITKTKEDMKLLLYKQIIPNWTALFILVCNHLSILEKY